MKIDGSEGVLLQPGDWIGRTVTNADGTREQVTYRRGDPEYDEFVADFKRQLEPHLPRNFMMDGIGKSGITGGMLGVRIINKFDQYYAGTIDEKELEDTIADVISDLRSGYADQGFDPDEFMPQLLSDVYYMARAGNIIGAYRQGWYDSRPLAALYNGSDVNSMDTIYYDSNYYYQTEEMVDTLDGMFQKIGQRYGVPEMDFQAIYDEKYPKSKNIYASYNTFINHEARMSLFPVGNMIDENLVPPKGFKFFYKGNDACSNLYPSWLQPDGSPGPVTSDGVLHVWYGDWSFVGRVPVRQDGTRYPISVNMFDVVSRQGRNIPGAIVPMLKNFDFFSCIQSGRYYETHPRNKS